MHSFVGSALSNVEVNGGYFHAMCLRGGRGVGGERRVNGRVGIIVLFAFVYYYLTANKGASCILRANEVIV